MIIDSIFSLYFFNYLSGIEICNVFLNHKYINYTFISIFLSIQLFTHFLQGTKNNNDILIKNSLFFISRLTFFFTYLNTINLFINNKFIYYIIPLYLPYYLDGGEFNGSYILPYNSSIRKFIFKFFKYKDFKIYVKNPDLFINTPTLLGIHPHGLIPTGLISNLTLNPERIDIFKKHMPHLLNYGYGTGATFNYFFPIIREIYLFIGAIDCSKPVIKNFLNNNSTIGVFIGGGRECKYSGYGKSDIIINKRLGFFKLALETGCPIIPIYTFGENNLFNSITENNNFLFNLFHRITGLWFPIGYLSFKKDKIITTIGDPIYVEKKINPTIEDIISLQCKYKKNLTELFDHYKHLDVSCKNNNLNFIE